MAVVGAILLLGLISLKLTDCWWLIPVLVILALL